MPRITNIASGSVFEDLTNEEPRNLNTKEIKDSPDNLLKEENPAVTTLYPTKGKVYFMSSSNNKKLGKALIIIFSLLAVLFSLWFVFVKGSGSNILSPFSKDNPLSGVANYNRVVNDLTGEMFKEEDVGSWKNERPLGVMVNNHVDARPQSGLIYADLVYEIVAEGGITRFLAFYLTNAPDKIGPVRSTREYYLVLVKELSDAMIMHIGWSPQALIAIENWPVRSLARGGATFWRDNPRNVATEHTAYVDGKYLRKLALDLGWEGKGDIRVYSFKDNLSKYSDRQAVNQISIDFWNKGDYSSIFKYNQQNNTYLKFTGYDSSDQPIPHKDQETDEQIEIKNLVVQFVSEVSIVGDDKGRLDYQLVGSGKALVFIDGKVVDATWSKLERDERTLFYDTSGAEIEFNRGKFWIAIVPDRNVSQVVYN